MTVKILIKRKIPKEFEDPLLDRLIRQLRSLGNIQPGYISGETLKGVDRPDNYLVISTWQNAAAWDAWRTSPERAEIQQQIDALLGVPTEYEIYGYL